MTERYPVLFLLASLTLFGCSGDSNGPNGSTDEVDSGSGPVAAAEREAGAVDAAGGRGPIELGDAGLDARVGNGERDASVREAAVAPGKPDAGSGRTPPPLDCGPNGVVIENAGPPKNRVNYVILGDGYRREELDGKFIDHIRTAMSKRFSPIGEPYRRYRKFVNICAIKTASESSPIGSGPTAFSCTGDDESRLARCDQQAANRAIMENLPASFEVDWKALVLNNDRWWNTGAVLMLWSGAHKSAAGAALHEGGHGFHQLADEYNGSNGNCAREYNEVNSTADMSNTAGKWDRWLNYDQAGATGRQGTFPGSRYCQADQYRPSSNSMMNSLFGDNPNTSFNSVSREKMIMDIWRVVRPVDESSPPAGAVDNPSALALTLIDDEVIDVDWSVDGNVVAKAGGPRFDVAAAKLSPGMHTITARAYDNAGSDLVRYTDGGMSYGRMNWARSQQTITWMVTLR